MRLLRMQIQADIPGRELCQKRSSTTIAPPNVNRVASRRPPPENHPALKQLPPGLTHDLHRDQRRGDRDAQAACVPRTQAQDREQTRSRLAGAVERQRRVRTAVTGSACPGYLRKAGSDFLPIYPPPVRVGSDTAHRKHNVPGLKDEDRPRRNGPPTSVRTGCIGRKPRIRRLPRDPIAVPSPCRLPAALSIPAVECRQYRCRRSRSSARSLDR